MHSAMSARFAHWHPVSAHVGPTQVNRNENYAGQSQTWMEDEGRCMEGQRILLSTVLEKRLGVHGPRTRLSHGHWHRDRWAPSNLRR